MLDNDLVQVALGKKPADLVIRNGKLVNVITHGGGGAEPAGTVLSCAL